MAESAPRTSRGKLIGILVAAAVVIGALITGGMLMSSSASNDPAATESPNTPGSEEPTTQPTKPDSTPSVAPTKVPLGNSKVLPKSMSGEAAIEELGDKLDAVAKKNGMTPEELKITLRSSPTTYITPDGYVFHRDTITKQPD